MVEVNTNIAVYTKMVEVNTNIAVYTKMVEVNTDIAVLRWLNFVFCRYGALRYKEYQRRKKMKL